MSSNCARDEFTRRVAKTVKGTRALIEAGFEKVDEFDGVHICRKRKYTKLRKDNLNAENRV